MQTIKERRTDFCTECRKETEYELQKVARQEIIREKEYTFRYTTAICKVCGEEMDIPGLLDLNIRERDTQFRKAEDMITVEEIKKLMELYHIGKAPLSLALGFGEVTISRYLDGQVPSKNYSDIMKRVLHSPMDMAELLDQNRDKIGETAYKKAQTAVKELKELFQVSDKMLITIAYVFEQLQEVTPLALQKILYFIQGIHMVLYHKPIYTEDCCAWVHGPVYEKVYTLFKNFKYNPIEDNRFIVLSGKSKELADSEKTVIDLVLNTFGMYSGKVLEKITHHERPWMDAREGCDAGQSSHAVISKDSMRMYFAEVSEKYGVSTAEGLHQYIQSKLT